MSSKPPRPILEGVYAFAPNRATLGGTAYFILGRDQAGRADNVLVDAPANEPDVLSFIEQHGGVQQWVITHRDAAGATKALQAALQCRVIVQEQEAYLLPDVPNRVGYRDRYSLNADCEVIWTPGYSPGSACVYSARQGGILFTGRHLLPNRQGQLMPLRFSKTFHWPRQLRSVQQLQDRFSSETLAYACPAANTGFLRGQYVVRDAYTQLQSIDVSELQTAAALL